MFIRATLCSLPCSPWCDGDASHCAQFWLLMHVVIFNFMDLGHSKCDHVTKFGLEHKKVVT